MYIVDRQSNEGTNTNVKKTPSMEDSVSPEILPADSSKKKKCDQDSPKKTNGQNVYNKDLEPDHIEGQSKTNEQLSNTSTTEDDGTNSYKQAYSSSKLLRKPEPEASSDNESYDKAPRWQWKRPNGQWIAYPEDVQEKLRKNFLKNPKSTVLISLSDSQ